MAHRDHRLQERRFRQELGKSGALVCAQELFGGVKIHRPVRLVTVQKHGHGNDRDVREKQRHQHEGRQGRSNWPANKTNLPLRRFWSAGDSGSLIEVNERYRFPWRRGARRLDICACHLCP